MNNQNQYQTTAPGKEYPTPTCITTSHQNTATTMFCPSPLLLIEMRRNISLLFVIHNLTQGIFCLLFIHFKQNVIIDHPALSQNCYSKLILVHNSYAFKVTKYVSSYRFNILNSSLNWGNAILKLEMFR